MCDKPEENVNFQGMPAAPPSYDDSMAAGGAGGFAPPPPPGQVQALDQPSLLSLFLLLVFKALFSDVPWLAWKGGSSSSSRLISCTTGVREKFYVAAQAFTSFAACLPQDICFYGEEKCQ